MSDKNVIEGERAILKKIMYLKHIPFIYRDIYI